MKKFMSVKNILMTLALVILATLAMSAATAKADEFSVTYDAAKDELTATTGGYIYVMKSSDAATIKAKATPLSVASGSPVSVVTKAKVKEGASAYFYVTGTKLTEDTSVTPNFVLEAPTAKKFVAVIDYYATPSGAAIYSFVSVKDDVETELVTKKTAHNSNPQAGAEYSADGKKWVATDDAENPLNGKKLESFYGKTLYLRVAGVNGANGTAKRSSKALKVKIGRQATLKGIKVDVSKGVVALKNGMDYRVFASASTPSAIKVEDVITGPALETAWNTILPYNRDGKKDKLEDSIVGTGDFWACSPKVEANLDYFSAVKVKGLNIADIKQVGSDAPWGKINSIIVEARTSATEKKPCSTTAAVIIPKQAAAPAHNFGGEGENVIESVTDSAISFKAPTLKNDAADKAPAKYEMMAIAAADLDKIDLYATKFKSVKSGAAKSIKEGAKFKWIDKEGEKHEVEIAENVVILIRRAADKKSNNAASDYCMYTITKQGEEYTLKEYDAD